MHVILSEYHDSPRIDRQLFGRCARQGDPGSCQAIVSLQDELFEHRTPRLATFFSRAGDGQSLNRALVFIMRAVAQRAAERQNSAVRSQTMKSDQHNEEMLAFTGRGE